MNAHIHTRTSAQALIQDSPNRNIKYFIPVPLTRSVNTRCGYPFVRNRIKRQAGIAVTLVFHLSGSLVSSIHFLTIIISHHPFPLPPLASVHSSPIPTPPASSQLHRSHPHTHSTINYNMHAGLGSSQYHRNVLLPPSLAFVLLSSLVLVLVLLSLPLFFNINFSSPL